MDRNRGVTIWFEQYSDELFQYLRLMVGNREDAKDLLQDVFATAFSKYDHFDGQYERAWLYRITRNKALDFLKRKHPISYFIENVVPSSFSVEGEVELNEMGQTLKKQLLKLKPAFREVIILRKVEGYSTSETATILGWSESKVKTTLSRAMKRLEEGMEDA